MLPGFQQWIKMTFYDPLGSSLKKTLFLHLPSVAPAASPHASKHNSRQHTRKCKTCGFHWRTLVSPYATHSRNRKLPLLCSHSFYTHTTAISSRIISHVPMTGDPCMCTCLCLVSLISTFCALLVVHVSFLVAFLSVCLCCTCCLYASHSSSSSSSVSA